MNENREETVGGSSCEEDESVENVNETRNDETAKTFKDLVGYIKTRTCFTMYTRSGLANTVG